MRNFCIQSLQVDAYMARVLDCLSGMPDILEVEISPAGHWRPANSPGIAWLNVLTRFDPAAFAASTANGVRGVVGGGSAQVQSEPQDQAARWEVRLQAEQWVGQTASGTVGKDSDSRATS